MSYRTCISVVSVPYLGLRIHRTAKIMDEINSELNKTFLIIENKYFVLLGITIFFNDGIFTRVSEYPRSVLPRFIGMRYQ